MIQIHEAVSSPHPSFSFMRDYTSGQIQKVPDRALDGLRVAEQKVRPAEHIRQWKPGELVRYPASGFEGMVGTVVRVTKKAAWVNFGGWLEEAEVVSALLLDAEQPRKMAA